MFCARCNDSHPAFIFASLDLCLVEYSYVEATRDAKPLVPDLNCEELLQRVHVTSPRVTVVCPTLSSSYTKGRSVCVKRCVESAGGVR